MKKVIKDKLFNLRLVCEELISKETRDCIRDDIVTHIHKSYSIGRSVFYNMYFGG
jgi:hypothetical protein